MLAEAPPGSGKASSVAPSKQGCLKHGNMSGLAFLYDFGKSQIHQREKSFKTDRL
jgi:hypothetical protein